ncbi:hypothetical protein ABB37_09567 [Leptomonas pyrrhocoris]|uniref:Uncharacterized protein n=1 Tax=Leptomonas pyrrhocoris TaxID=157538 RepID=A0A0N0VCX0_LEPPY|nr:hypothetical protein ABB37_09567 [Leptomonas pyrrhocoris]XP_015652440.1 hypothetical protein ABB37_09567 [Leptomonas pyrrhocoris]KPA74000.1 hypothetical protein ABB37_09567 [Leptomonas pyrrhocoris]KPA74001.1 hypothetical protein ABB37_09567 [Leptomonas pyrrhocoris]|eukprot:XP_015652439.1 hypothetical protein ABB37_09567 [Leptomonas pyrrhocoris]
MPRIKRFDEVDTDSDPEFGDGVPTKKTMPTLSFKTTTDESDSISFESDHEKSQNSEHRRAPAPPAPKAPQSPVSLPVKHLPAGVAPPANFVKAKRKAPPTVGTGLAVKAAQQQPSALAGHSAASEAVPTSKTTEAAPVASASPPPAAAVPAYPAAPAPLERPAHSKKVAEPTPPTPLLNGAPPSPAAVAPSSGAYTPRMTGNGIDTPHTPQYLNGPEDSEHESEDFVQQVLPVQPHQQQEQPARPPPPAAQRPPVSGGSQLWASGSTDLVDPSRLRPAPAETAADELLIRAQLRLEEHRRLGNSAPRGGSRQPSPWRGALAAAPMSPPTSTDPRVRRLQQENARLQDEVAFLGRENQKLRGVQGSADASEAVRLQLTVDMLRKNLETKQVAFQRALDEAHAARKETLREAGEVAEQCESYQSSAEQYKQLYSDKQREVEKVKTQLQALLYDVNTMEQRHREAEAECNEKIANEREKTERALALFEEVKGQRDHLQFLNEQLRGEVTAAAEAKRQALDQAAGANDAARRDRADFEQRMEQLNQDVAQLRRALADKDRVQAAQLREAQQSQAVMQDRLKEQAEEQQREAERSRRTVEAVKEDQKRALQQERARRAEVEERLRRAEEESRAAQTRYAAAAGADSESRVRKFREELQNERVAREEAEREASRLEAEVEELHHTSEYYQQECQRMLANFGQSEQLREKAEQQCVALSHTLEDMMAQEDAHARQIAQMQEALSVTQWGAAGAVGRGVGAEGMVGDLQQLSDENDRLTSECTRLAEERDHLIEENGKIAEELLKWKHEMRQYVASHVRSPSSQSRRLGTNA